MAAPNASSRGEIQKEMFADKNDAALYDLFAHMFQAHPWHGVSPGERAPEVVNTYIEGDCSGGRPLD